MNAQSLMKTEKQELANVQPLDQNPAAVYLARLTKNGRRVQKNALDLIAGILTNGAVSDCFAVPWHEVKYQHAQAIRTVLQERYKTASANRMLSALRGVLKAAWKLEQMSAEQYQRAAGIDSIEGETLPAGRALPSGEKNALMAACAADPGPAGVRDAAIIALMAVGGLRRAEVVNLDLSDYDPGTGRLKILGKRNQERETFLSNGALDAVNDWLIIRGDQPGPLFIAINRGDRLIYNRMTAQAFYSMLKRRGDQAGIKEFSPHDLRRTMISDLLDAGADISTVAKMVGHKNVNTTARYDRRPEQAKQRAANMLHIPYTPRGKKG